MKVLDAILAIGLAASAACGGAAAGGSGAQAPGTTEVNATIGDGGAASPVATAPTTTTTPTAPVATAEPTSHVEMKAPVATQMVPDLAALGLDAKNLPPMEKLDPKALRGVMKLFARAIGGKCGDRHTEGDFAAPTPRKKIAAKMWNEWAAKDTLADGGPVFCDSCHQGRQVLLDRADKKALSKWMETSFVDGLKRKDGKDMECETCHVGMEMKFLSIWSR